MARSVGVGRLVQHHIVTLVLMMSLLAVSMLAEKSQAAAAASVTVLNEALVPVSVYVKGGNVQVATGPLPVHVNVQAGKKEETVEISLGEGKKPIYVNVKNGDTIVIIPDFLGGGMVDVNVNGIFKGHL